MPSQFLARRKRQRGIALVSVLWVLSLLSVIAAAALSTSRLFATLERAAVRGAEAEAIAEAGIVRAVLGLLDKRPEVRWRVDGVAQSFTFNGVPIEVTVQDELGKFDLNAVDEQQIKSLFVTAGLDEDNADALADRVVAWRSAQPSSASQASEGPSPRYGPFHSIGELKLVEGVTPEIFARIEPAITVHSRRPTIDPQVAPRVALLALPGVDRQRVDEIVAERTKSGFQSDSRPGVLDANIPLNGRVFAITVKASHRGLTVVRTAVVQLTTDPQRPYLVLDWR